MPEPSRAPTAAPASRPSLVDFLLLLTGCGLSLFLARLPLLREPAPRDLTLAAVVVPVLPTLLRLPEGVILFWPLFFLTQLVLGRSQRLTAGEWLWVAAWPGTALVNVLAALVHGGVAPESFRPFAALFPVLWYAVLVPSLAVVAVVLALAGLSARVPPPWTHHLGLALVIWPVLPLAGLLTLGKLD
jgi:hypothetical protein